MNSRHKKVLKQVFHDPVLASIIWSEVENFLIALGAKVEEAAGSRLSITLNGIVAVFHRPHPRKEMNKGAVKSLRKFLTTAGMKP